jgi:hypothetical protein
MKRSFTIILILLAISGCSSVKTVIAMMQTTDNFTPYGDGNSLIFQEIEPSPLAKETEKYLAEAIDTVEGQQNRKFGKPVKVYIVSTVANMKSYCGYRLVLGCVINEKVFLSPRVLTQPKGTLPRILTHELSHLHIDQQLGLIEWANVPTWFREGLAVYVSTMNASSAELDFKEAATEMIDGKSFYPNEYGSIVFPKSHVSFGLSRSIFYRQAGSFVRFLHISDEIAFKNLLLSVQDKEDFSSSFQKYYGVSMEFKWREFVEQI